MNHPKTYVVELTPPGRGAIAVVLVAGPDATAAVDVAFSAANGKPLGKQSIGRIVFGQWIDLPGGNGEDLVVCRRGADHVEIHPHGGMVAVKAVIDQLVGDGCTQVTWKDWIAREDPDPIRAAAQMALADAPTERTAAILLDQYHGALRRAIDFLRHVSGADSESENTSAADREVDDNTDTNQPGCRSAGSERDTLLARAELGFHLTRPWKVVLAGPPNVGKSSLVNAILGYTRAIVFDQPGTTRDVVTAVTAIDGWPIEFSDTAGLRVEGDAIEVAGVELARKQLAEADLVVWIEDAQCSRHTESIRRGGCDEAVQTTCNHDARRQPLFVLNKIDLLEGDPIQSDPDGLSASAQTVRVADNPFARHYPDSLLTSATTGAGISALLSAIATRLVPDPPPSGAAVPFTAEQVDTIRAL